MGNLLFWLGIGAAQKGAGSKPLDRRNRALSFAVGTLLALLIAIGMFILLVNRMRSDSRGVDKRPRGLFISSEIALNC
jgi:hypothetical protein